MKPLCILALASALIIIPSCKKEEPVYNGDGGKTPVPEAVDLGIMVERADGTEYNVKWASWNLGASSEAEAGDLPLLGRNLRQGALRLGIVQIRLRNQREQSHQIL